jgi:hypothetical protein
MDFLSIKNNYNNFHTSTNNRIEAFEFDLGLDTYYIKVQDIKKEFIYSNITIVSVSETDKNVSEKDKNVSETDKNLNVNVSDISNSEINFFSNGNRNEILLQIRKVINDINVPYFMICTKNFLSRDEGINMVDLLVKIFNFSFIKFHNTGLFWYGIVINSFSKYILEENLISEDQYKVEKLEYNNLTNQDYLLKKQELDETMDKLVNDCKELTIRQVCEYKKIINKNMEELNNKIDETNKKYDLVNDNISNIELNREQLERVDLHNINENEIIEGVNVSVEEKKENDLLEKNDLLEENNLDEKNDYELLDEGETDKEKEKSINEEINNLLEDKTDILLNDLVLNDNGLLENDISNDIDNISKELSLLINKKEKRKYAFMVHLYKIDVWEDIFQYIEKFYNFTKYDFDLYINIALDDEEDIQKEEYQDLLLVLDKVDIYENYYLTFSDNRGMDIGGFFTSYLKMIDLGLQYENIIKIHSKTNFNWRFCMLYSLLGSNKIIKHNIEQMENEKVGMIGNKKIEINNLYVNSNKVTKYIDRYYKFFNIENKKQGEFIPGTIFWIKGEILEHYFTKNILETLYEEMPKDYCGLKENKLEGLPHGFERFFGVLVNDYGSKTCCYDNF